MKITKAVIACGGWSTRFLPAVKSYAKHLVPILDKPQVQYLVEECLHSGITQICIVHRPLEKTLARHFQPDQILEDYLKSTGKEKYIESLKQIWSKIKFTFIPQDPNLPYGNGSPILSAVNFVGSNPFVYFYGDDFLLEDQPGQYLNHLIKIFSQRGVSAVCAVQKVPLEEINRYCSVKFKSDSLDQIETVVEKPNPQNAPSNLTMFGRFVFDSKIINILKNTTVNRGELWLTDAVNNLAQKHPVLAIPTSVTNALWMTTGDPLNWLKANLLLAFKNENYKDEIKNFLLHL